MKGKFLFWPLFIPLFLYSCQENQTRTEETAEQPEVVVSEESDKAISANLVQEWATDSTLRTPESAYFHSPESVIYVSNIDGEPLKKDGNGFISKVSPDGKIQNLKWVTGLNAPKGIAISDNTLYVTDIDRLVAIGIDNGKILKTYPVQGAKFLNDVAIGPDTTIYFSDSKNNKIHTFKNGKVNVWMEGLNGPNGLQISNDSIYVAMMNNGEFKAFSLDTKEGRTIAEGIGAGDGVVSLGESGEYLVSNWNGEVWFIKGSGKKTKLLDTKQKGVNSADIGIISKEDLVLVPTFNDNRLVAYKLTR